MTLPEADFSEATHTASESSERSAMARAGTPKKAPSTKAAFLLRFEETGRIDLACKQTGIGRRTHYNWLEGDPDYRKQFEQSRKRIVQLLEDEAYRRAVEGVEKPIKVGDEIKTIREYSDTLLIFLLKGAAPEKYRERYEHALGAPAGQSLKSKSSELRHKSPSRRPRSGRSRSRTAGSSKLRWRKISRIDTAGLSRLGHFHSAILFHKRSQFPRSAALQRKALTAPTFLREIAAEMGVSPAFVCRALKARQRPPAPAFGD